MAIVKKLCCLLVVVIFYCNAVFAIRADIIDKDQADYRKAAVLVDEVVSIAGTDTVVLQVYFDELPEVKFSSGASKFPGSMCPGDFFDKNSFEQQAAHLLFEHHFPLEKFKFFPMILAQGASDLTANSTSMAEKFAPLKRSVDKLPRIGPGSSLKDLQQYLKTLPSILKEALSYIECPQQGMCPLYERLVYTYYRDKTPPSAEPTTALEEAELKIWEAHQYRILMRKQEAEILPRILSFLFLPREDVFTAEEEERELPLRLYCHYWGGDAEDALIYFVLQHVHKMEDHYVYDGRIPATIEIYGNKDPCFQCQVKLQWLADYLTEIGGGTVISYYSRGKFQGPCLYADLSWDRLEENKFTTRREGEENKLKKFMFVAGAPYLPVIFEVSAPTQGQPSG